MSQKYTSQRGGGRLGRRSTEMERVYGAKTDGRINFVCTAIGATGGGSERDGGCDSVRGNREYECQIERYLIQKRIEKENKAQT